MDSGDEVTPFVPPFELFPTELGSGSANSRVSTSAIGIKTKAIHHNLLRELFSQLFSRPPMDLAHFQYSLCGIATIIGHAKYQALLCKNNKFFSTLTTIPVAGIDDSTLGLEVTVPDSNNGHKTMTIREIFQQQDWCLQVEPTQTPGKLLFVTTKAQVSTGHKWLDENLEPLFKVHLPCNPQFQQSTKIPLLAG